ncbi:MAG: bifunctional DedA family/phosphatase PAP2 family protein [Thermoplasmatota archaeon]
MAMTVAAAAFVARYAYLIVFVAAVGEALPLVGMFVPGQISVILAAIAASRGHLSAPLIVLVALAAGVIGDGVGYSLGRARGRALVEVYGPRFRITGDHLASAERLFARFGPAALILARFSFVTRGLGPLVAGIARMKPARFWTFNVLGAALWASLLVGLGYTLGAAFLVVEARFGRVLAIALLVVALVALLARAIRKLDRKTATRLDVALAACSSVATLLFAVVAVRAAAPGPAAPLDNGFDGFRAATAGLVPVWSAVGFVGGPYVVAPLLAAIVLFALTRKKLWAAFVFAAGVGLGDAIVRALKSGFGRPRPLGAEAIQSLSFPSGHAAAAVVLLGGAVYFLARRAKNDAVSVALACVGGAFAALVGLARIGIGDHYPSDVLGGYLLGAAWLFILLLIAEWGLRTTPRAGPRT